MRFAILESFKTLKVDSEGGELRGELLREKTQLKRFGAKLPFF